MVHIMWFNGTAEQWVDTLARGGASTVSSKHVIANPLIHFRGARAVTETNAIIVAESTALGYVCTSHIPHPTSASWIVSRSGPDVGD
jgi:hypothetical protein